VRGIILVALGGALGSVMRYLSAGLAARWLGIDFPWGTLAVNLVGSLLIGVVNELAGTVARLSPDTRVFLATGLLGGLTTYSAFSYETAALIETQPTSAVIYVVITTASCVALCVVGMSVVRYLAR
jgi:fluoride exporter